MTEVWLRGPLPQVSPLLQPVAHALLQASEEVDALMQGFPEERLWERPAEVASPGFHLQHLAGVLDRLFTYARGESLNDVQARYLAAEGAGGAGLAELIENFHAQVDRSLEQLRQIDAVSLTEYRAVGRAQLPSTVLGLLVHAAEHTQRHVGQLLVTVRIVRADT
jgi:hypothetical protein